MKRKVRLTESDLHNLIKESVIQILSEGEGMNDEMFNDAVEAIEMSDGMIDFYEWYPAFQDYVEPDEAEEVFNRALRECGYLTESKLHRVIKESVIQILSEGEGRLQSSKLEQLIKQHGGIKKNTIWRIVIPYIKDEDIIGIYPGNFKGMGKYNRVDVYLEREVLDRELNRSEEILDLELNDGNSLYFVFDNAKGRYDRLHKSVYGDKTKPSNGYRWENPSAEYQFHNKDIRTKWHGWTPEKHREEMSFIKGMHKQNMDKYKQKGDS